VAAAPARAAVVPGASARGGDGRGLVGQQQPLERAAPEAHLFATALRELLPPPPSAVHGGAGSTLESSRAALAARRLEDWRLFDALLAQLHAWRETRADEYAALEASTL